MIYLDHAATTNVLADYKSIIDRFLYDEYGNPGSKHSAGVTARKEIQESRRLIASIFDAQDENIIFTASGSEANNLAILGLASCLKRVGKDEIITTAYEHKSVLNACNRMEELGFTVHYCQPNQDGTVNPDDIKALITENTGLVSVMKTNNELGTTNPTKEIYELCQENGILFHSDYVQAVGLLNKSNFVDAADFISVSGHKIHAPKGVGFLYVKNPDMLDPIVFGGGQEFGKRAGTENVASISVLAKAFSRSVFNSAETAIDIFYLINLFVETLEDESRENGVEFRLNIPVGESPTKVVSLGFPGIDSETMLHLLSVNGVCVSAGSACNSREVNPSYVLKAIGLSDRDAMCTIRVSFSEYNTPKEVCEAARIMVQCAKKLRAIIDRGE